MALPSKESLPRAGRATRFAAPVPPLNVPVARSSVTPVVFSGSISSYTRPPFGPPPASSANRIVPQGVRRDGSQPVVPVTIVATTPGLRLRSADRVGRRPLKGTGDAKQTARLGP